MTRRAPLVAVIVTSSLLAAAEASILCTWTEVFPAGQVHYSFLRSDPRQVPPSLRLYHSSWSGERALLGCAWSDDAAVVRNYLSLCRQRAQAFPDRPGENHDVDIVLETEAACVSPASAGGGRRGERAGQRSVRSVRSPRDSRGQAEGSEVTTQRRVKRGFIVPGTLWCGSGNKAPSYEDLGVFTETDSCCREHDHCKHTILSFHSEFGVFNRNIFTMSHCDCDNKFRSCLMEANDSIAHVVGYTFFNLLKMHCFEFSHRLQCTQRNWFGMCKETKMALYAEVHSPKQYESPDPTEVSVNGTSTEPVDPRPPSGTAAASPAPSASPPSASVTPVAVVTASTVSNTSEAPAASEPESRQDLENALPGKNRTLSELEADSTETQRSCDIYRDLDECKSTILPQQRKYGLHNPEARTMYHCNCTTRLFQTLAKQRRVTKVQNLVLGHVSPSCFLPQDCTDCTAALVEAELPPLEHRSRADVGEQRHLQAVRLKVRRPNPRGARRKEGFTRRLRKLCLRVVRPESRKHDRRRRPNVNVTEGQH